MDDRWKVKNGFNRKSCFEEKHTVMNDQCCGSYPNRIAYAPERHTCCSDGVLREPGNC